MAAAEPVKIMIDGEERKMTPAQYQRYRQQLNGVRAVVPAVTDAHKLQVYQAVLASKREAGICASKDKEFLVELLATTQLPEGNISMGEGEFEGDTIYENPEGKRAIVRLWFNAKPFSSDEPPEDE